MLVLLLSVVPVVSAMSVVPVVSLCRGLWSHSGVAPVVTPDALCSGVAIDLKG